jgi:hypothetical protein
MVWWPFATQPERADTLEVTDLHSGAPLLYSTSFVVNIHLGGSSLNSEVLFFPSERQLGEGVNLGYKSGK